MDRRRQSLANMGRAVRLDDGRIRVPKDFIANLPQLAVDATRPWLVSCLTAGVQSNPISIVNIGRVEEGRGSLGHAATPRFPSPLIKPDVRISRIRLSDRLHRKAHGE